ncbi:HAD-IIA family hydrolase [Bacteroides acidifaciens]|jgi:NagD protein|uniref:HAD-IIA family hydrolase n=1 Tax=Bacteroides acidifaciens TaxID=85831 RepID=UPI0025B3E831|nr:HAD-IIA family hydrolase [Bacteroides acidifaciens]
MIQLKDIELFLFDMDGTIYHENTLIPGTTEFFNKLNSTGQQYAFMSNNSSKGSDAYIKKLDSLGLVVTEKQIISSVTVSIAYLKNQYSSDAKIYLVGTESLKKQLIESGFNIVSDDYRGADVTVCMLGYDTELTYSKLSGACFHISNGADYIATNCDLRCPVKDNRFIPDCGAIAKMIECATGKLPHFLGKPEPEIVYSASKIFGVAVDRIMCVGDRLYTDIAVGINAGAQSALVLTGEAQLEDVKTSSFKPTYIFKSIKEMAEAI